MNLNSEHNKSNSKFKESKQSNYFIPRNPNSSNNTKNRNNNFASRDHSYQQYNNFQKANYVKDENINHPNPFEVESLEIETNENINELEAKNSPEYYNHNENYQSYSNYIEDERRFWPKTENIENNFNKKTEKPIKTTKITRQNYSELLHEDENQFFNYLSDAKSVVEITDLNSKMNYREKYTGWINSFFQLNQEILQKHEKTTKAKINIIEKIWSNISFTAKSIYYSITTFFVSLLMLIFWLIFADFNNFTFWQYIAFSSSFIVFLMIIQVLVYFNNAKNRRKSKKLIFYYTLDSSLLLINYLIRLVFLLSPLFTDKLIVFNPSQPNFQSLETGLHTLNTANKYAEILYYIAWFPALSYFFGICFFIPLKWSECVRNFWLIFGIFKIFSYLRLVKEYKTRNNNDNLRKTLNKKWINLYQIGRPLNNSLHPAFIYAYSLIKSNPNLPIDEQDKLVSFVFHSVNNDIAKHR
ncbi:hypothetical protein DR085_01980 [Mycoplasma flocculare]|uniref:hypothetical protein n=1 Tax=Mesomycoplasma flocculare TaxID=2128 RepID=UPI00136D531E|nr:hypothetical protein [Mesomycoplasma flocculare]MXR13641.1 hypothetical protein [Mesomycoplasma flocculare]